MQHFSAICTAVRRPFQKNSWGVHQPPYTGEGPRTPQDIAKVKTAISDDPSKSLRKLAQEVNGSYSSVWRIARKDLGLTPYKVTVHHQLTAADQ